MGIERQARGWLARSPGMGGLMAGMGSFQARSDSEEVWMPDRAPQLMANLIGLSAPKSSNHLPRPMRARGSERAAVPGSHVPLKAARCRP